MPNRLQGSEEKLNLKITKSLSIFKCVKTKLHFSLPSLTFTLSMSVLPKCQFSNSGKFDSLSKGSFLSLLSLFLLRNWVDF